MTFTPQTWPELQAEAEGYFVAHAGHLAEHGEELQRVAAHFGLREAMEYARGELGIHVFATLMFFGEFERGEEFGLFAL